MLQLLLKNFREFNSRENAVVIYAFYDSFTGKMSLVYYFLKYAEQIEMIPDLNDNIL